MLLTNTKAIVISGLAELIADIPGDDWYEMRVRFRKAPYGPEAYIVKTANRLDNVYRKDGEFWYRDENDELQVLDD